MCARREGERERERERERARTHVHDSVPLNKIYKQHFNTLSVLFLIGSHTYIHVYTDSITAPYSIKVVPTFVIYACALIMFKLIQFSIVHNAS